MIRHFAIGERDVISVDATHMFRARGKVFGIDQTIMLWNTVCVAFNVLQFTIRVIYLVVVGVVT